MKKYDYVFLSISSNDLPCYKIMRDIARKYFGLFEDKIKIFFIELKTDMECDVYEKDDYIYVKGEESIKPGIYKKTIKSIEYINKHYEYDYLIRTNLSSFWNLNKVLELKPLLPRENFCGGIINCHEFISGTGIMISKDTCHNLVNLGIIESSDYDDVHISKCLKDDLKLKFTYVTDFHYTIKYYVDNLSHLSNDDENILYYRIKNQNDRNIDVVLFDLLCKHVYNI